MYSDIALANWIEDQVVTFLMGGRLLATLLGLSTYGAIFLYPPLGDVFLGLTGMLFVFVGAPFVSSIAFLCTVFSSVSDDYRTAMGAMFVSGLAVAFSLLGFGAWVAPLSVIGTAYAVYAVRPGA